jgi:nucleoid-associated protein YgaU
MGLFDSIKNVFGGKPAPATDSTVSPSQMLRDAGIDPSGLQMSFAPGSITVSGEIAAEADRARILEVLRGAPGIDTVNDNMVVAAPAEPEPEPQAESGPKPAAAEPSDTTSDAGGESEVRTYTVQAGDTLWKIAEAMYGSGAKYMKIFEANSDILDNPDLIHPGQELKIPEDPPDNQ